MIRRSPPPRYLKGKMATRPAPTIKHRIMQITLGSFLMTLCLAMAFQIAFSSFKQHARDPETEQSLTLGSTQQMEQLIPSFLLPEQREGSALFLSKVKNLEGLTEAQVAFGPQNIPSRFNSCELNPGTTTFCSTEDHSEVAALIPVNESGRHLGYIFKAKAVELGWSASDLKQFFAIFAAMIGLTFAAIYFYLARILSRQVSSSIQDLVLWIESELEDRPRNVDALPFKELESLKNEMMRVMERHTASRDQAVVGQLASGIMHDIRTPLHSIVTALHLFDKEAKNTPKHHLRAENLAAMCRINLPLIGSIIESTLDVSRNPQIHLNSTDLLSTVRAGVGLCDSIVAIRKAHIEVVADPTAQTLHDPTQMSRVVQNLIKNAVEATEAATPCVRVSICRRDNEIKIKVEDNGPGLKGSGQRIFRVFCSSKVRGNGLGLHISRKIIEAHGGSIGASNTSTFGGAKFEIVLPLREPTLPFPTPMKGGLSHEAMA